MVNRELSYGYNYCLVSKQSGHNTVLVHPVMLVASAVGYYDHDGSPTLIFSRCL